MTEKEAKNNVNKIFKIIFNTNTNLNLEELKNKYAFDIKLPKEVNDSKTGEITYTDSINSKYFLTQNNMNDIDIKLGWMQEKQKITNLEEIITYWNKINYTTTERIIDSINISKSDTIYRSQNVYNSTNCSDCKNIIYSDSCYNCEYLLASSRSDTCSFCIKVDDSANCSNSFNVIYSNKVSNSFFVQDCFNLDECMFCSHIANKKYCIANMQFTKEEYLNIKNHIVNWIVNS